MPGTPEAASAALTLGEGRGTERSGSACAPPLWQLCPAHFVPRPMGRALAGAVGRGCDGTGPSPAHTGLFLVCFHVFQIRKRKWVTGGSKPLSRGFPSAFGDPSCSGQSTSQSLSPPGLPAGALATQSRSPGSERPPPQTCYAGFCHWRPTESAQGKLRPHAACPLRRGGPGPLPLLVVSWVPHQ